ncbi:ribose-phosphate pyrophosphokinase [Sphingomonas sp.]|jgi:hypothetical protein|uniref:ribose-phosphate pyrophosphokinase n=1 Tax=Sphingomonas sp. TaxID=28214 RepID=UPI003566FE71
MSKHRTAMDGPAHPPTPADNAIGDVARVRAILIASARAGEPISYSHLLAELGHRFTRPKMRAVCKTLDAVDSAGAEAEEPGLAVLVVRESDGLPGQGWWVGGIAMRHGYDGPWTGAEALAFVRGLQEEVFAWWSADRRPKASDS